jgi:hypothetical protein
MIILVRNVLFGLKKRPLLGLITLLRPSRTFLGQKRAIKSKISIFSEENYQERLVLVQSYAFFRPMSTSLSPKRPSQAQKCPNTGIFT